MRVRRHRAPALPGSSRLKSAKSTRKSRQPDATLAVGGSLWLQRGGHAALGGHRIALLESIDALGSITRAAKAVGLSYKGAWDAVDAINNMADQALVLRATGGRAGGGSRLTEYGRQVVQLYRQLESGHQQVLARMQADQQDPHRLQRLLKAITLRTSARNQFHGTVRSVQRGAVNADVTLDVGDGLQIVANITNESVAELGLRPGRAAMALIKSNFVLLAHGATLRISARNRLPGTVQGIVRGAVNSEVKLQLAGGRTMVAIVTNESLRELGLRKSQGCCAVVNASHVLIAVND